MGSKGSNTTTSQQSYAANPAIADSATLAIQKATNASNQPFQMPTAPVAGFNDFQTQAFDQTRGMQGMAQPYFNTASNLAMGSAGPVDNGEIAHYYNPMADNVLGNLRETQQRQMGDVTGRLTQAAGGVGADRIAVGQAELGRQQNLAYGQTAAGLYQPALAAAQQDKMREANAGYALGQFGQGAQSAYLQGTGALGAAGNQQQRQAQAGMNAPYQNRLAEIAYPFQTAQYLAGISGGLAPALGGTTNAQTTGPAPNPMAQYLGIGAGLVGLGGSMSGSGGKGGGGGVETAGNTSNPFFAPAPYAADGGRINGYAEGGEVGQDEASAAGAPSPFPGVSIQRTEGTASQIPYIRLPMGSGQTTGGQFNPPKAGGSGGGGSDGAQALQMGLKMASMFLRDGGAVGTTPFQSFDDGGNVSFNDRFVDIPQSAAADASPYPVLSGEGLGQKPNWSPEQENAPALIAAGARPQLFRDDSRFSPQGSATTTDMSAASPMMAKRVQTESYPRPPSQPMVDPAPSAENTPPPAPRNTSPYGGGAPRAPGEPYNSDMVDQSGPLPYPQARQRGAGYNMANSPWMALAKAGFATAASKSPFLGTAIGEGASAGISHLDEQRKETRAEEGVNQQAARLAQEAKFHLDTYQRMKPNEIEARENEKTRIERDSYHAPIIGPYGDYAVALPKNPNKDKPIYYPLDGSGQPDTARPAKSPSEAGAGSPPKPTQVAPPTGPGIAEAPPAEGSIAPSGGRVVTADPARMTSTEGVGDSATRNPAIGAMYYDPKNRGPGRALAKQTEVLLDKHLEDTNVLDSRAKSMKRNLDVISAFAKEDKSGIINKLFDPGATGEARLKIINAYNDAATKNKSMKQLPQDVVAAVNALGKDSTLAGFKNVTAEGLSAREAQPIIRAAMAVAPSFQLPEAASRLLISGMEETAQAQRDKKAFFNAYRAKNGGYSDGWQEAFNKQYPPSLYIARTIVKTLPQERQAEIPMAVKELRQFRDGAMAAEKSGDNTKIQVYNKAKAAFDKRYGSLSNYYMFGTL